MAWDARGDFMGERLDKSFSSFDFLFFGDNNRLQTLSKSIFEN